MFLHVFFLLCSINSFVYPFCVSNKPKETNWEEKLKKNILCPDIEEEPPNKNSTTVRVRFRLKTFNFEDNEELFYTYNWIFFSWHDSRLTWNPTDYDGIDQIILHPMDIWTPIRNVKNMKSLDEDTDMVYYSLFCSVSSDGTVSCIPRVLQETVCSSHLENWPYDTQNCTFIFSFGRGGNSNVFLTFNSTRGISALGAEYGNGWDIVDFETSENHNNNTELYITYVIERRALGLVCMIVIPAIIIAILSWTTLFLDVMDNLRLYFVVLCLLSHFYFLRAVSENLPHHGPDTPKVLIFIRSSIFITTVAILITLILKISRRNTLNPPMWVIITNNYISKSFIHYLIFPKCSDNLIECSENRNNNHWPYFACIVNSAFIYSLFVTYQILFIKYIPQAPTVIY